MESNVRPGKRLRMTKGEFENYDVFLSHRGPDTKTGFVGFLYEGLEAAGLRPFLDCESIDKGQDAWICIDHAIKTTPIAMVIFSESFTQSEWCLKELHVMLETPGIKILPVFYKVLPSEVSFPGKGQLAAGFEKLKQRHDEAVIKQWKEDLRKASKLNGWEYTDADRSLEKQLVKNIVGKVFELANMPLPLDVGEHVIGVHQVAKKIIQKLDDNKNVLMLGLWGMGGIGKSTLARELFNQLSKRFVANCFVDVADKVIEGGMVKVQNCILKNICKNELIEIEDKSKGKSILEKRLCEKKILLVLDDVRESDDIDYWISRDMLSPGSMCIVTSRNRRVFFNSSSFNITREVHIHNVQGLSNVDSTQVFVSYAFGHITKVKRGFQELVENISKACRGIPLVLKVCGALLKHEEDVDIWEEVLKKLNCGTIMDESKIFECLRISYDVLQQEYQEMFLDIACVLLGKTQDMAIRVWRSLGWSAALGVRSLIEKALITVDDKGRFNMHDHLRDMGREIVQKRKASEGIIRRLWMLQSLALLKEDEQLPKSLHTLIIFNASSLFPRNGSGTIDLDISHMKELRILICDDTTHVISSLPRHLYWLDWEGPTRYSSTRMMMVFPSTLQNNKLVMLNLKFSRITSLPESFGELCNLEMLNLGYCKNLVMLPYSFGGLKKLQNLNLEGSGITSLPESFGELNNLEVLNLQQCEKLLLLPNSFRGLKNLRNFYYTGSAFERLLEAVGELDQFKVLDLSSKLIMLSNLLGILENRRELNLSYLKIETLPESFEDLSNLELLDLKHCKNFILLPSSFGCLRNLQDLKLEDCGVRSLPESFGDLSNLEVLHLRTCCALTILLESLGEHKKLRDLDLERSGIKSLPKSIWKLSNLEVLNLNYCREVIMLPESFGGLRNLCNLKLKGSEIQSLPESFRGLGNLKLLDMGYCNNLSSLPNSFGSLKKLGHLKLEGSGIQSLPESFGELSNLEELSLSACDELTLLPLSFGGLKTLQKLDLKGSRIQSLLESFGELSNLEILNLASCKELILLPCEFGGLKNLRDLTLENSGIQSLPESFGGLSHLEVLNLSICRELVILPDSFGGLGKLRTLQIGYSGIESLPKSFGNLSSLERLDMTQCQKFVMLPDSFGALSNLKHLNFTCLVLLRSLCETFGGLSNLQDLDLSYCRSLKALPQTFTQLKNLRKLDLQGCLATPSFISLRHLMPADCEVKL